MFTKNKQKKEASDIYNAFTLWLTSIFAIPLLSSILVGLIASKYVAGIELDYLILVVSLAALVPGTMYASSFINKRYLVENKKKVINYATLIAIVLFVTFMLIQMQMLSVDTGLGFDSIVASNAFFISSIGFLAKLSVFYITATSRLKED